MFKVDKSNKTIFSPIDNLNSSANLFPITTDLFSKINSPSTNILFIKCSWSAFIPSTITPSAKLPFLNNARYCIKLDTVISSL